MTKKAPAKKKPGTKNKGGRPKEDLADKVDFLQVERLAGLGLTNEEIGRALGVSGRTVERWQKDERFLSALKRGKEVADRAVVKSLYKRALGYSFTEVTEEGVGGKLRVTKKVRKVIAPDVTAQIFWLKNRRPKDWRDRIEHTGAGGGPLKVELTSYRDEDEGPGPS